MQFKTAYGPKEKVAMDFSTATSMTKQSFKDECDVNLIIKKYSRTGIIAHLNELEAQYGDLVGLDFQEAMDLVAGANSLFEQLPAAARKKFRNDPAVFLDFMSNPANADQMVELGLATKREVETELEPTPAPGPAEGGS